MYNLEVLNLFQELLRKRALFGKLSFRFVINHTDNKISVYELEDNCIHIPYTEIKKELSKWSKGRQLVKTLAYRVEVDYNNHRVEIHHQFSESILAEIDKELRRHKSKSGRMAHKQIRIRFERSKLDPKKATAADFLELYADQKSFSHCHKVGSGAVEFMRKFLLKYYDYAWPES